MSKNLAVQQTLERVIAELDIKLSTEQTKYKNWIKGSLASLKNFEQGTENSKQQRFNDIDDLSLQHLCKIQRRHLNEC